MTDSEPQDAQPTKSGPLIGRLLIVAFMGAVVMSECLFAYFWLPSADEVAAQVELVARQAKTNADGTPANEEKQDTLAVEVDLGKFQITNHSASESTFRVDFHLFGTVSEEDLDEFNELFPRNSARFRNQVLEKIRDSKIADLEDAGLGLIKRRILEKSNALFGKPLLRSVVFADYTFVEL